MAGPTWQPGKDLTTAQGATAPQLRIIGLEHKTRKQNTWSVYPQLCYWPAGLSLGKSLHLSNAAVFPNSFGKTLPN